MHLAKVLLSRLKMAVPSIFPTAPSVSTVSVNQQMLLTVRVQALIRKGGKIYQMLAHLFSVFEILTEAPVQHSVVPVESILPN